MNRFLTNLILITCAIITCAVNIYRVIDSEVMLEFIKTRLSSAHLWSYGIQVLALFGMQFYHRQRIKNFPISDQYANIILSNLKLKMDYFRIDDKQIGEDQNVRQLILTDSIKRLRTCYNIIFALIITWAFLYLIVILFELGLTKDFFEFIEMENLDKIQFSLIRILNYFDSILLVILAVLFVVESDLASSIELSFKHRPFFMSLIFIGLTFEIVYLIFMPENISLEVWLTFIIAILSSICFLTLFARMESIFLELNKFFLSILFLYGLFQIFYPFEMINWNGIRDQIEVDNVILYLGTFVKFIGKISLAYIICSEGFRERILLYFCSIFNIVNKGRY